jgi:hypothetical protein
MIAAIYARMLIAALCLLALATAASAECACVLWDQTTHRLNGQVWTEWHQSGYPTYAECDGARSRMIAWAKGQPEWKVSGEVLEYDAKDIGQITRLSCLPDTVDPRGPKGK